MINSVLARVGIVFVLGFSVSAQAMNCAQIREKAAHKKGKSPCVLLTHTIGIENGSSVSTYQCGKINYILTQQEDDSCVVKTKK
jgi:hypothetical protein